MRLDRFGQRRRPGRAMSGIDQQLRLASGIEPGRLHAPGQPQALKRAGNALARNPRYQSPPPQFGKHRERALKVLREKRPEER